jgi:hypothetical protein
MTQRHPCPKASSERNSAAAGPPVNLARREATPPVGAGYCSSATSTSVIRPQVRFDASVSRRCGETEGGIFAPA